MKFINNLADTDMSSLKSIEKRTANKLRPFVNKLKYPHLGRRTGKDILAGKQIRKLENGLEVFEDYFSDKDDMENDISTIDSGSSPKEFLNLSPKQKSKNFHPAILKEHIMYTSSPLILENNYSPSSKKQNNSFRNTAEKKGNPQSIDKNISVLSSIDENFSPAQNPKSNVTPRSRKRTTPKKSTLSLESRQKESSDVDLSFSISPHKQKQKKSFDERSQNKTSKKVASIIKSLENSPYNGQTDKSDSDESESEFELQPIHTEIPLEKLKLSGSQSNRINPIVNQAPLNNQPTKDLNPNLHVDHDTDNSDDEYVLEPLHTAFSLQQFKNPPALKNFTNRTEEKSESSTNSPVSSIENKNKKVTKKQQNKNRNTDRAQISPESHKAIERKEENQSSEQKLNQSVTRSKKLKITNKEHEIEFVAKSSKKVIEADSNSCLEIDDKLSTDSNFAESYNQSIREDQVESPITEPPKKRKNDESKTLEENDGEDMENQKELTQTNMPGASGSQSTQTNSNRRIEVQKKRREEIAHKTRSKVISKKGTKSGRRKIRKNYDSSLNDTENGWETIPSISSTSKKSQRKNKDRDSAFVNLTPNRFEAMLRNTLREREKPEIIPPSSNDEGLRRSKRPRLPPLDFWRNERPKYQLNPDVRGTFSLVGIHSPPPLKYPRSTKRNDEVEDPEILQCTDLLNEGVMVINPERGEEVRIQCVNSKSSCVFYGPNGKASKNTDPLKMCRNIRQLAFSTGYLILNPKTEKPRQNVQNHTLSFLLLTGKILVTIHETTMLCEKGSEFFIPSGNYYSIKNVGKQRAELYFTQINGENN